MAVSRKTVVGLGSAAFIFVGGLTTAVVLGNSEDKPKPQETVLTPAPDNSRPHGKETVLTPPGAVTHKQ